MPNITKISIPVNGAYQDFNIVDTEARNSISNSQPLIIGTQTASTGLWTGNAPFDSLLDGQKILFFLPYAGSGNASINLTLSDGTTKTGDILCYLQGSTRLTTHYEAGSFIPLIYKKNITFSGSSTTYTGWWAYSDRDVDNNTYLQNCNNKLKAGSNGIHGFQLVMQTSADTWESLTTSYTTATTKTKNSKGFYLGNILYHNNGAVVTSGNYTGTWRIMEQKSDINFSYSSNCGSTLVANKPVYLVGTINNGLFYLADTWWSQELPTTDDGKVYIYIGISYSTTSISKFAYNPIFWYNNGCVELYNGNGIKNINNNTTKAYLLGTTTNSADSGKQIYDDNIYSTEVAGRLNVKSLQVDQKAVITYNNDSESLNFIFNNN